MLKTRIAIYWAYNNKDQDSLFGILLGIQPGSTDWGSGNPDRAIFLLMSLGLKGDEYQRAKAAGANEYVIAKFAPEHLKSVNMEAMRPLLCQPPPCTQALTTAAR